MKSDVKVGSQCPVGMERWEKFRRTWGRCEVAYQYAYRAWDGLLFSCVASTIAQARVQRDAWLVERAVAEADPDAKAAREELDADREAAEREEEAGIDETMVAGGVA